MPGPAAAYALPPVGYGGMPSSKGPKAAPVSDGLGECDQSNGSRRAGAWAHAVEPVIATANTTAPSRRIRVTY
jgi:hypothetical protein